MPYKVMLVDDDSLVRRGLKSFVDWEKKGLVLAGEAADGGKALELLESLRPDIVITDMYMPNYNGLKFIQEAQASFPDLLFIVLSCHNDIHYVKESMRLGAFDYLLKSSIVDSDELDVVLDKAVASLDARSQRNGAELWEAEKAPPERVLLSFLRGKTDNVSAVRGYLQAHQIDPASSFCLPSRWTITRDASHALGLGTCLIMRWRISFKRSWGNMAAVSCFIRRGMCSIPCCMLRQKAASFPQRTGR